MHSFNLKVEKKYAVMLICSPYSHIIEISNKMKLSYLINCLYSEDDTWNMDHGEKPVLFPDRLGIDRAGLPLHC